MKCILKSASLALVMLLTMSLPLMVMGQASVDDGEDRKWVCCEDDSLGCTGRTGFHHPKDYLTYTMSCGCD